MGKEKTNPSKDWFITFFSFPMPVFSLIFLSLSKVDDECLEAVGCHVFPTLLLSVAFSVVQRFLGRKKPTEKKVGKRWPGLHSLGLYFVAFFSSQNKSKIES